MVLKLTSDVETNVPAHTSERENSDSEGFTKVCYTKNETLFLYSLPKIPKLRRMLPC